MRKLSRPSSGAVAFDCGSTRSLQSVSSSSLVRMGSSRASAGESSPAGLRTTVGSGFAHGGFSHGVSWACEARGRDDERKRARREDAGVGSGEALAAGKGGLDLGADEAGADFGSGRKAKAEDGAEAAKKGVVSAGASTSRSQRGAEKGLVSAWLEYTAFRRMLRRHRVVAAGAAVGQASCGRTV